MGEVFMNLAKFYQPMASASNERPARAAVQFSLWPHLESLSETWSRTLSKNPDTSTKGFGEVSNKVWKCPHNENCCSPGNRHRHLRSPPASITGASRTAASLQEEKTRPSGRWPGFKNRGGGPNQALASPIWNRTKRRITISSPNSLAMDARCSLTATSQFLLTKPWSSKQDD